MFASSWQDFDTVCMATAMHRLGKLEVGREAYDYLAKQPDFIRLLTLIGGAIPAGLLGFNARVYVGREAYDYLAKQPDFIRLLTLIGGAILGAI